MTTHAVTAPEGILDTRVPVPFGDTSVSDINVSDTSVSDISVLDTVLRPLSVHYERRDVVELRMVCPGEVIVDRRGEGLVRLEAPELTLGAVGLICQSLANEAGLEFHPEGQPNLSVTLPGRHRFECLLGPSVARGLSLAIRCKHPFDVSWDQIGLSGAALDAVTAAVEAEANIIVAGATNTGKTTFLNKALSMLPEARRVVSLEDTPELDVERFWNGTALLAARDSRASTSGAEGVDSSGLMSWRTLYDHCMRITPDNILFGEISTSNAFAALAALNSGVTGFMCTIHAESPEQVINRKFDQNIAWAGESMPEVSGFLRELVDMIVQIKRDATGMRRVTDIWLPKQDRYILKTGEPLS